MKSVPTMRYMVSDGWLVVLTHVDSIGLRMNEQGKDRVCSLLGGNIKVNYMKNLVRRRKGEE